MTLAGRRRRLAAASDSWDLSSHEVGPAAPSVLRQHGQSQSHAFSARVSLQATAAVMNRLLTLPMLNFRQHSCTFPAQTP